MKQEILAFWSERNNREKQLILMGVCCVAVALVYFSLWLPATTKKSDLKEQVNSQKELLQWMQKKAPLIQNKTTTEKTTNPQEIFSLIQKTFENHPLANNLIISRMNKSQARIQFNNISFDDLLKTMITFKKQHEITVYEMRVSRLAAPGLVEGEVILSGEENTSPP